jgi:lycopene cyclase domain-containing protein
MERWAYFLIDIGSISVPLIASFHPRLQFHKQWRAYLPACLIAALAFCLWDILYTGLGVWGFTPRYLLGVNIVNLPLEEVLFFLCIPYASVFTYHCLNTLLKGQRWTQWERNISMALVAGLVLVAATTHFRYYTTVTFVLCAALIAWLSYKRAPWLGNFYRSFVVTLIPFFIVNGMLTGTGFDQPIVWYNDAENLGIRMGTIPVEDTFYGMLLLLLNVMLYEQRAASSQRHSRESGNPSATSHSY